MVNCPPMRFNKLFLASWVKRNSNRYY